jgi:GNAT superfamily N-acetyltransferase
MSSLKVRQLRSGDDLAEAITLLQRFFREEGFDTPDQVIARNTARLAGLEICGLFVAEVDGTAAGVATVSMDFGVEFGWSGEMGDLYVLPAWRGRGVSKALVDAVEAFLHAKGASGYQVTITPHAAETYGLAAFYGRLGFDHEGRTILFKALR